MVEDESVLNNNSDADEPVDYTELIEQEAFLGDTPYETILDGIHEQFRDYISTEDRENYVNIFYNQLHKSYETISADDGEEHPQELRDALEKIHNNFITEMNELFNRRLNIHFRCIEDEDIDYDELEYEIRLLYEFFIINAKDNFMKVISKSISKKIDYTQNDQDFYNAIEHALLGFSPYIIEIGPVEFITLVGNTDVAELYDDNKVVGNFLAKYSPRLFANEDFKIEIIAEITSKEHVKEEILHGGSE